MKVWLDHTHDESENIRTFYFRPEKPVHYTAGQFIELTIPEKHSDDRGPRRWFTLSSSPTEEYLSITTKRADKQSSSFKKFLFTMAEGQELHMSDPMGAFVLPKLIQTPLLFVAGGIGLTPFHSMATWLADTKETRDISFIYGVRNEDEIIFQDTFSKAAIDPKIIVTEPTPSWGGERGRITAEKVIGLGQPSDETMIYLSGPEGMVQQLEKDLHKEGVDKQHIITDEFPNYEPSY